MTRREFKSQLEIMMIQDFAMIHGLCTYEQIYQRWDDFVDFCKAFTPEAKAHFYRFGNFHNLVYK